MADKIRLLPEVVANQIAAGEVVNRPSSVVKEMMENAIDAGARSVKVNFRDGGKELIQLIDDGCGMSPADARLAFDRHATSKIRTADDLYALRTFGFRGEALASIAAVAQVELRTRCPEDELGTEVTINGGLFAAQKAVACPAGSQFFVRNLFYNVPARMKFLKKDSTEGNAVAALALVRLAKLTAEERFRTLADRQLAYLSGAAAEYPAGCCFGLLAVAEDLSPRPDLLCAAREVPAWLAGACEEFRLSALAKTEENARSLAAWAPFTQPYPVPPEGMALHLCRDGACFPPVGSLEELRRGLLGSPVETR